MDRDRVIKLKRDGPGWEFRQNVHESSVDFIICISGYGVNRSGETRVPFEAGDVLYAPAGLVHGTINIGDEPGDVQLSGAFRPPAVHE